ncbi:MAG: hypothetical protein A2942_02105 [Candidatus Lloydbacteria bacterium RIFCSPLOWO2_01_FULL_50_20]|uniref:N-acetyltransferase domain-containing protein n=1 Tax=Candidatus Lloydbacteria bacterium RIFCSPLOWO2_01_FULL_50_20 TaxID=1798665 RepID=A0A1G2DJ99_9BACT|nr:MAG: hypothetical protein A3C13_03410 [Candidatus Lloydbacteria bacterium RIFCSPHIGHO2_02_FULL_50_11]OGZ13744.1 MAG: hypothetical protein A2942_02105 [Candidatus Lloydbacteria bacterium RIFCSPLOWO2_01_FULL_50_20]
MKKIVVETLVLEYVKRYRIPARYEGRNVGHVYVYIIGDPARTGGKACYAYVDDLLVDESVREKGGGRKLMEALLRVAKSEHCYKVIANCHRRRRAARALYSSMGFAPHGREFRLDLLEQPRIPQGRAPGMNGCE